MNPLDLQSLKRRRFWLGYALGLMLGLVPVLLAVLPPFVPEPVRAWVMLLFTPMCHQLPARSWHVDGVALAVCHRCFGIYAALPLGALTFGAMRPWRAALRRHAKPVFIGALTVPGVDWIGGVLGVWASSAVVQSSTGAFFGLAAGYYLAQAFSEMLLPAGEANAEEVRAGEVKIDG